MEMKGILGRKIGMTQVFSKSGDLIPVTVIEVEPNVVTQIKTKNNDGYDAIQLGFATKRAKLATKASIGHTNKANTTPKRFFKEIRGVDVNNYSLGQEIKVDIFVPGEMVDVTGTSKGKGFQGVIKRHNQARGPMSHGSHFHRAPGSLGSMEPKRVFKGKALPGHMGSETVTIQNLEIISVDLENNAILVKGNVPGPKKSLVFVKTAVKNPGKINEFEGLNIYEVQEESPVVEKDEKIEATTEVAETVDVVTEEAEESVSEVAESTTETEQQEV